MARKNRLVPKNSYQQYISIYIRRRAELKANKDITYNYTKKLLNIKQKLDNWRRTLRKIEAREKRIQDLIDMIKDFTGSDVYLNKRNYNKNDDISKGIFFKYGMEHRMGGAELSRYIGFSESATGSKNRFRFTRSFKDNPENKKIYHEFLQYVKFENERKKYQASQFL